MDPKFKLNLGCGFNKKPGYLNVDKFGAPDVHCDLEVFPWPWPDSSVSEVLLIHVLEHLGQQTETYFKIMQELYRVCEKGAQIHIEVPHPRHDDFINDPTHVRIVTPSSLELFSQKSNNEWIQQGYSNSTLGLMLDVNFEILKHSINPDPYWLKKLQENNAHEEAFKEAIVRENNAIKSYNIILTVIK